MTKTKKISLLLIATMSLMVALCFTASMLVKPAKADSTPVIAIDETASISYLEEKSIRFTGSVSDSVELSTPVDGNYLPTDTYAGIIVAKGAVSADSLTAATAWTINFPATVYGEEEGVKTFSAVIEDLALEEYNQTFTARAYIYANGTYSYSATVCQRSLAQVASKIFAEEFEGLLFEERAELRAVVEQANPVVKVGDVVLDDTIDNQITITVGQPAVITVEPANLTLFVNAEKDNKAVIVTGNEIDLRALVGGDEYVYVDVGAKFYIISVKSTGFYYDSALNGTNVLANFNNEKALMSIQDGTDDGAGINNSISYVAKDSEEAKAIGATSGVIKVDAGAWDVAQYKFQNPYKVNEIGGIYIKYKMPATMEWDEKDTTNGIMYVACFGSSKAIATSLFRTYKVGNGGWNYLAITNYDMRKTFGVADTTVFDTIAMMPVYVGCVFYIDEIGIYDEKDATMINSFDGGAEQNGLVFDRYGHKWQTLQPGDSSYPSSIGATTGVLRIAAQSGHGVPAHVYSAQLVPTKNLTKIKIRLYVPKNTSYSSTAQTALSISFNESFSNQNSAEAGDVRFFVVTRGQWNEIEVAVSGLTSEYIYGVSIYKRYWDQSTTALNAETAWYLDYIQAIYA